jgi:hypothetical protein
VDAEHVKEDLKMDLEILIKKEVLPLHLIVELFSSFLEQKIYFLLSADEFTLLYLITLTRAKIDENYSRIPICDPSICHFLNELFK